MLALLIPGKQSITSDVFDVYLEPLVEELLQLWEGVEAYDVTKEIGDRAFRLRAMLLWTIHDFPGYGTIGGFAHQGFAHQGFAACPSCGCNLGAEHSVKLGKQTYTGTRRWLPPGHSYKFDDMKEHFTGFAETHPRPEVVSAEEQVQYANEYCAWKEAGNQEDASGDPSKVHGVKRVSILNRLPY